MRASTGQQTAYHVYYPFGEEATTFNQDTERMKFTGHERDLGNLAGAGDDLDYMHARTYGTVSGRFQSPDRLSGHIGNPQTWNRYTYAVNNPLCLVDPDGLRPLDPTLLQFFHALFGSGADFTNIDIRGGFDGHQATWIAGASAVTIGDTIFVGADQDGEIRKRSPNAVALLAHELTHAYQASGSGRAAFLIRYASEWVSNINHQQAGLQAYQNISFEVSANAIEAATTEFLRTHEGVREKLRRGETLSEKDTREIRSYIIEQASEGRLKEGLQFISGTLVRVSLVRQ